MYDQPLPRWDIDEEVKKSERVSRDKNPRGMAANPLNSALLCILCDEFEGTFREKRAQLYLDMVTCVLRRCRKKKGLLETEEDLTNLYKPKLNRLVLVALNGLFNDRLDFIESELVNHAKKFGFLSVQPALTQLHQLRFLTYKFSGMVFSILHLFSDSKQGIYTSKTCLRSKVFR